MEKVGKLPSSSFDSLSRDPTREPPVFKTLTLSSTFGEWNVTRFDVP